MDLNEVASKVRGIWGLLALCIVACVGLAGLGQPLLGAACLIIGTAALAFAWISGNHGSEASTGSPELPPADPIAPFPLEPGEPDPGALAVSPGASELDEVIYKNLSSDVENHLGHSGDLTATYFVDLRRAALVPPHRDVLVRHMAQHILDAGITPDTWHILAAPKDGNSALALALAEHLGLAPMMVRQHPLNGRYVECALRTGRVLLFEDVASDEGLLLPAVQRIREAGYICTRSFLLIKRAEGTLGVELGGGDTGLAPVAVSASLTMADVDFAELVQRVETS